MAVKSWTWLHGTERTYVEQARITPDMVGGPQTGYGVEKHRLYGGLSDGVDVVHVDNGVMSFEVLPTRGMSLWKAWVDGQAIGWNSPVRGPVHPSFVPLADPGGLGWLDGFDELFVRCGLESNGAPEFAANGQLRYGLHGRIGNKPAQELRVHVDGDTGEIRIVGVVEESRFHFFKLRMTSQITTWVGQPRVVVTDVVENFSASPTGMQLLYHINFGPPLLGAGSQVVAPVQKIVPRTPLAASSLSSWMTYPAPVAGTGEQVYFFALQGNTDQQTAVQLQNPTADRGVSVHFNTTQLPCFTLWKNPTAEADGYVTGLEPATNFPNPRSYEETKGRVVSLAAGEKRTFEVELQVQRNAAEVARMRRQIEGLQQQTPEICSQPQPGWCADA